MKILCIADEEDRGLWDYWSPSKTKDVDLIISCGDLSAEYLEFLQTMVNVPLLYIRGNHDGSYDQRPPLGCDCLEDRIIEYKGLRIGGLGGSMKYNEKKDMYTEQQMEKRVRRMEKTCRNAIDILVTHAPAKGYGDLEDLPHQGFACFNDFLEKEKPMYLLHGHVHKEYGSFQRTLVHPSGTIIINAWSHYFLEIDDDRVPKRSVPDKHGRFFFARR